MYDKSLEHLIDGVIADGIITDQERKVVYKKAKSLGIDQDEIEVYLDGRLVAFKNSNVQKNGKHGVVKTCPHCGANVRAFSGRCPECGHEFTDITGNSTVKELIRQLDQIEKNKPAKTGGFWNGNDPEGEVEEKKAEAISLFPIPNTKADLIEFATLCASELKRLSDSSLLYDAWKGKSAQIINKTRALFPDDPEVTIVLRALRKEKRNFFKGHSGLLSLLGIIAIFGVAFLCIYIADQKREAYTNSKIEAITNLPTPNKENYKECFRMFGQIAWTEEKENNHWDEAYSAFEKAQNSYRELLLSAYKEAGVAEKDIPNSIKYKSGSNEDFEYGGVEPEYVVPEYIEED